MIHTDRVFSFKELESEDDLVEVMTKHRWPLCMGFHYLDRLYLNDGDLEEDPEYFVMTIDKTEGHHGVHGREVGRIRAKQADEAEVHRFVKDMSDGRYSSEIPVFVQVEPCWHHNCELCKLEEDE